jgi:hypothetical protein
VTTDGQGTWVAVWTSFASLGGRLGSDGDVLIARSTDAGISWTKPDPLNTNARSDDGRDDHPEVTTDGQGTWVAVWDSYDSLGGAIGGNDRDILMAESADAGATWSAPAPLNSIAGCDAGDDERPQLTTDGQGTWIAVWQSSDPLGDTIGSDSDILASLPGTDPFRCQTSAQQKCINALNGDFARVAGAQDKAIQRCLKSSASKGESATACLALPGRGMDKARAKTRADEDRLCSEMPPDFGPLDADVVNDAAEETERATLPELFGADLDAALVRQADDRSAAKCQQAVVKAVYKCQGAQIEAFNGCKETALKRGGATSPEVLARCLGVDADGKVAKECDPLSGPLATKVLPRTCGGVDLLAAFPGCGTADPGGLASCLDEAVACGVCLGLSEADGLGADCDLFDDGVANASCQ